jgi:hypothetical protein
MHLTDPFNGEDRGRGLSERQLGSIRAIVYLALLVLVVVFGIFKLWQMPMASADFKFTDFVVVGLALFAIWLSVSIVDRAAQENNRFHEGTQAALRDMAQSLARLDEDVRSLQRGTARVESTSETTPARSLNNEYVAGVQR